ncbi:hypothetical protein [Paraburkholderia tropica]|uniref:Uncharacterized protein n=1 Tax=Paraburkholderia tropica TaxID=92647 RepID=A0ABX5MUH7_9BURK|nr:hypothetical protein [Paraburkholderia tropica]MDE1144643.1 hypothetical protein [Paraburkholderia tropica]PXX17533.1 hypothetical protein C7400_106250 [Paraburkholderia tropica]PZW84715.1 hypothetical protein C7399_106251 [Paraburkholderia tropica]
MNDFTVGTTVPQSTGQSTDSLINSQLQTTQQLEQEIEQLLMEITQEENSGSDSGSGSGTNTGTNTGTTTPTTQTTPTTDNLTQMGSAAQQQGAQTGMQNFQKSDPTDFNAFMSALQSGDGNKATHILADAVRSGKLDQSDAAAIGSDLQQTANENGGGKINGSARDDLANALGQDVLAKGETRDQYAMQQMMGLKA